MAAMEVSDPLGHLNYSTKNEENFHFINAKLESFKETSACEWIQ